MASAVVNDGTNSTDRQEIYCHYCVQFFMVSKNSPSKCPECQHGFVEEVDANWVDSLNEFISSLPYTTESTIHCLSFDTLYGEFLTPETSSNSLSNVNPTSIRSLSRRPMTDAQLQEIPKATITGEQTNTQCAVCLENFKLNENEVRQLHCNHLFHEKCIFPWVQKRKHCPICRSILPNADLGEDDSTNNSLHDEAFLEYRRQFLIDTYGYDGYLEFQRRFRELNEYDSSLDSESTYEDDTSNSSYNNFSYDSLDAFAFEKLGPIVSPTPHSYSNSSSEIELPADPGEGTSNRLSLIDSFCGRVFKSATFEQPNHERPSTSAATGNLTTSDREHGKDLSYSSDDDMASSPDSFRYFRFRDDIIKQIDDERPSTSAGTSKTQWKPKAFEINGSASSCDGRCGAAEKVLVSRSTQTEDTTNEPTLLNRPQRMRPTLLNRPQRMRLWNSLPTTDIDAMEIVQINSSSDDDDMCAFQGTPVKRRNIEIGPMKNE